MGVYQLSCGPIPMKIGGNFSGGLPDLPIRSKNKEFSRKTTIIRFKHFKTTVFFFAEHVFPPLILNVDQFVKVPGYEPIHLDLEKLFLLSVSKENLDFRGKHEKNLPYNFLKLIDFFRLFVFPRFCYSTMNFLLFLFGRFMDRVEL